MWPRFSGNSDAWRSALSSALAGSAYSAEKVTDPNLRLVSRPSLYVDIKPEGMVGRALAMAMSFTHNVRLQFLLIVTIPTALAIGYYGLVAQQQYVSHVEFIVKGADANHSVGFGALLSTIGISRTADDASAIESFIKSRDAIRRLEKQFNLRELYGRSGIDPLSRFPRIWESDSFESLYAYLQSYISIKQDSSTGLLSMEVAAFRAADAKALADALLAMAEDMANNMNARAQATSITEAERELGRARDQLVQAQMEITNFRNKEMLVDPVSFAGVLLENISQLSSDQARTQIQLSESANLSPQSPQLLALKAKSTALSQSIDQARGKLAGNETALSEKLSTYERLSLQRELADKRFAEALTSLQTDQAQAQHKRVYVEEVVQPNLPDESTRPERLRAVMTVFVCCFALFAIFWIISVGSKDHAQ